MAVLDSGMMGGWHTVGWLWTLIPLVFWGGLLALIAWAVVRIFPGRRDDERRSPRGDYAEDILRERFARGEIDAGEYESSLTILRGESRASSTR